MDQAPLQYFFNTGGVTPLLWCVMLFDIYPQTPLSNASILSRKNTIQVKNSHHHLIINCALIGCHKFICPFICNNDSVELLWLSASMSNEFDFNAKMLEQCCGYSWGDWRICVVVVVGGWRSLSFPASHSMIISHQRTDRCRPASPNADCSLHKHLFL